MNNRIAIVGMGGIFPACRNLEAFWQLLQAQRTTAQPIPSSRSGHHFSHFHHQSTALDKIISPYACYIEDSLLAAVASPFQNKFGGDPLVALTLAATQQALDDTVSWPQQFSRERVNVIIGNILLPTEYSSKLTEQFYVTEKQQHSKIDPSNRFASDLPAHAIGEHFALHGDRYCLDAACASTLYALKLAMDDLDNQRADTVICGGVLRTDGLYPQMGFSQLQALSPSGRCLPFTAAADGLLVGEGAGIFVLKRLDSARQAGDRIHGILRAVGLSNDVQGNILAPDSAGQLQALRAAYQQCQLSPHDIDYIECHATGAPRGDQVEITSLAQLYAADERTRRKPCLLGAVKSNIGHLLTAAGAAGLAKILLALQKNTVPPNVGANNPATSLAQHASWFKFNDTPQAWEREDARPRRAALSGFGFGGINSHLIVEEYLEGAASQHRVRFAGKTQATPVDKSEEQLAIVASAAHCGTLTDVQQLYQKIFSEQQFPTHQKHIASVQAPLTRYRLPPAQLQEMLPQQLLMLNTAFAAASMLDTLSSNTAIYIGLGLDCNTANFYLRWQHGEANIDWPALTYGRTLGALGSIVASRIARFFVCRAPAFTVANGRSSGLKAFELACSALRAGEIDSALVGAVDFATHPLHTYATGVNLAGYGDGACVLILKPFAAAQRDGNRIFALLDDTQVDATRRVGDAGDSIVRHIGCCGYAAALFELLYGVFFAAQGERVQVEVSARDGYPRRISLLPPPQRIAASQLFASKAAVAMEETSITLRTPTLRVRERNAYDYRQCLAFARGRAATVLGEAFAPLDSYPVRVRLPDEPLLLCHRILHCEGRVAHGRDAMDEAAGYIQTAHDVRDDAWYLDHNTIPLSVAVEAGQADLFLCSWLGIDFINKGNAVYRLLDAQITCMRPLPSPPATIIYDIHIDRFFKHGTNWFFKFRFVATVNGETLLRMENGCAGFFTAAQLAAGRGIPAVQRQRAAAQQAQVAAWPLTWQGDENVSETQLAALRAGQLVECFGKDFSELQLRKPCRLPGGRMQLLDRITSMQAEGGDYRAGLVISELDIKADAWFLTCHFVDDLVMPGTLMYECAQQTLRVYLMRRGWVGEAEVYRGDAHWGSAATLQCRGQVTAQTRTLRCEVHIKESGTQPSLYCIADAYLYVDDQCSVTFRNMSLQHTGLNAETLHNLWSAGEPHTAEIVCSNAQILQFAEGDPARCFGERYAAFSKHRRVARLPRPPYKFLDRIVAAQPQPAAFTAQASCVAEYDLPPELWCFDKGGHLPFCVLLEIALQPCGWLAAYIGCALQSEQDLSFRNLDGHATQHRHLTRKCGTLTTHVRLTKLLQSMGMILCRFALEVSTAQAKVYTVETGFGFFTATALATQTGVRGVSLARLPPQKSFAYPRDLVNNKLQMIDTVDFFDMQGGQKQLGLVQGSKRVDAHAWFFQAHFYQDPVVPGSLGLESLLQLFVLMAHECWGVTSVLALAREHTWTYRGQVVPSQQQMTTQLEITQRDNDRRILVGDGLLAVDGLVIYRMMGFAVEAGDD